jgi:hypothetical protein
MGQQYVTDPAAPPVSREGGFLYAARPYEQGRR